MKLLDRFKSRGQTVNKLFSGKADDQSHGKWLHAEIDNIFLD
jgi:hypothetical protein